MLSEAETYPDWIPQDPADESAPAATEPTASTATAKWGIPDPAGAPDAPTWSGIAVPAADTVEGPSFWASPSTTPSSPPPWDASLGNKVTEPIAAWTPSANAWADTKPDLDVEAQSEAPDETFAAPDVADVADESPFHEVAAAYAAANDVPVAEREVFVPAAGQWNEPGGSTDALVESDEPAEFVVADDVAVAVETNRRSRLSGRRKFDRVAGPDSMPRTETAEPAAIMASNELVAMEAAPKGPEATKTPKPQKADKAAGAGFFTKKAPSETGESTRETPMVLRIAALASLLVGVGLFGYTVVNGRQSSPTAPAVTVAPPASVTILAPESAGSTPNSAVVVAPVEDPIFGAAPTDGTVVPAQSSGAGAPSPAADDNGLAFDTTANFGS